MSRPLVLELNDLGLRLSGDPLLDGLEPSLGWAVLGPDGIVSGSEAATSARLHPRAAHRAIWGELSTEPLPRPFPRGASTADLAYAQLERVWSEAGERLGSGGADGGVLLVASGGFASDELGLVLGIAASLEIPVTGIVDSAVAAASTAEPAPGRTLHVDLELSRAVVTELEAGESTAGPWLARRRVRIEKLAGWNALLDLWAREVGRAFVSATRFDPLHTARSEQDLYDRLPEWLSELSRLRSIEATMGTADREHRVLLTRDQIAGSAEPIYERIAMGVRALAPANGEGVVLLSDRVARAPGLAERLEVAGVGRLQPLDEDAASAGALANVERIKAPGQVSLPRVTRLFPEVAQEA